MAHGLLVCTLSTVLCASSLTKFHSRLMFQITMVIVYPTIIQPLFNKLSPLPAGELRSRTEELANKLKFPLTHLYEIDGSKRSSHSNAYFFGLPWVCTGAPCHRLVYAELTCRANTSLSMILLLSRASRTRSRRCSVSGTPFQI